MLFMSVGSTPLKLAKLAIVIPLIFNIPGRGVGGEEDGVGAIPNVLEISPFTKGTFPNPRVLFMVPLFIDALLIYFWF